MKLGDLKLVCTPARHFSGRSLVDRDKTLWASWVLLGPKHRVYFSGDTALFPGFRRIGERFGPFDLTMIETGAYNAMWADVHLGPEQAVAAHQMLRGKVMLPIHWGMFDLGLHGWTEPIERSLAAAEKNDVTLVTVMPGEQVEPSKPQHVERWWPNRPWETAEEAPIHSSGM
jgi:L-ascorbate metabolism protein UlaG (beta-lactamase superfamily)